MPERGEEVSHALDTLSAPSPSWMCSSFFAASLGAGARSAHLKDHLSSAEPMLTGLSLGLSPRAALSA